MNCVLECAVVVSLAAGLAAGRADDLEWHAAAPSARLQTPTAVRPVAHEQLQERQAPIFKIEAYRDAAASMASFQTVVPANPPVNPEPIGPPRTIESEPKPAPARKGAWRQPASYPAMPAAEPCAAACVLNEVASEPARRFFFRSEYLLWFTKEMKAPPLVATAPNPAGSPPDSFGFIGQPGTSVLYGGGAIGDPFHQGARFSFGMWVDDCETCGLEASYFFLGDSIEKFHADSNAFAILTRPFFRQNPPNPQESGQIISFPPGFTFGNGTAIADVQGAIDVRTLTGMWGAEFNAKECLCRGGDRCDGYRVDLFAGFRYLDLQDRLTIQENLLVGQNDPVVPAGTQASVTDKFSTHNQFYGGQIGFKSEYHVGSIFAEMRGSVAIGGTAQTLVIDGGQQVTQPGQPTQIFRGGLLALPSNMGRHTLGAFSVAPELAINAGVDVRPGIRLFAGYDFMLWTRVMRASEQIDRVIDVNQVPNFVPPGLFNPIFPERPMVLFRQNDFWAQGVQFGMELRW